MPVYDINYSCIGWCQIKADTKEEARYMFYESCPGDN